MYKICNLDIITIFRKNMEFIIYVGRKRSFSLVYENKKRVNENESN